MSAPGTWPEWWDDQMMKAGEHAVQARLETPTPYGPDKSQAEISMTVEWASPPVPFSQAICEWLKENMGSFARVELYNPDQVPKHELPSTVSWEGVLDLCRRVLDVPPVPITPDLFRLPKIDLGREFRECRMELSSKALADAVERDQERAAARRFAQAWDSVMFDNSRNPFIAIGVA
jgi:hypothetical protein